MSTLKEILGTEPLRPTVITDCIALIDAQVKTKGFFVKSAYATVKAIKRKFVPEVVDALLDEWLDKMQPHYDRWAQTKQSTFADHVIARSDEVAEDLLSVTDARAAKTTHSTAKKMYNKMRDSAKKNVIDAIPDLSRMIERHLAAPPPVAEAAPPVAAPAS
jgi:hypothetical protein